MEGEGLDLRFQDASHWGQVLGSPGVGPPEELLATASVGILGCSRCILDLHSLVLLPCLGAPAVPPLSSAAASRGPKAIPDPCETSPALHPVLAEASPLAAQADPAPSVCQWELPAPQPDLR